MVSMSRGSVFSVLRSWRPGIQAISPLIMLASAGILIQLVLILLVLGLSNGDDIAAWTIQPSVYLTLLTSGLSTCTAFIYAEGTTIGWWLALMRGTTLKDADLRFRLGSDLIQASLYPFRTGRINRSLVACIGCAIMFASGPIFQRASTVTTTTVTTQGLVNLAIAPELPYEYSSVFTGRTTSNDFLRPLFSQVLQEFNGRSPIQTPSSDCLGSCKLKVPGAGFTASCTQSTYNWTYVSAIDGGTDLSPKTGLNISFDFTYDGQGFYQNRYQFETNPSIIVTIQYKTGPYIPDDATKTILNGTINQSTMKVGVVNRCVLRPATVLFPITIIAGKGSNATGGNNTVIPANSTITLDGNVLTDTVVSPINRTWETLDYGVGYGTTYAGYLDVIRSLYAGNITIAFTGGAGYEFKRSQTNPFVAFYIKETGDPIINPGALVNATFRDPTSDVLSGMREMMFRMALSAASDPENAGQWPAWNFTNTPPASYFGSPTISQDTRSLTIYKTNWGFAAFGISWVVLVLLMVLPNYWGFWLLGRRVSMSPLEIARAFEAPLLTKQASLAVSEESPEKIKHSMKSLVVRYGEVTNSKEATEYELKSENASGKIPGLQAVSRPISKAEKPPYRDATAESDPASPGTALLENDTVVQNHDEEHGYSPTKLTQSNRTVSRLAVAEADRIIPPRKGVQYF
ncbi:hypothetical protein F5884DRAFT_406572 [Xylogone sp. PMI_703]|nr:hypothetical protein F5884DRAFT_406572 [Xylogone sp. PMI_703]